METNKSRESGHPNVFPRSRSYSTVGDREVQNKFSVHKRNSLRSREQANNAEAYVQKKGGREGEESKLKLEATSLH